MKILLNIIILIFEILYYSLFMKYSKKSGKMISYIILFTIATLLVTLISYMSFFSYVIFVVFVLIAMKYIFKIETSFFDLFIIFIMMVSKIAIETGLWAGLCLIIKDAYIMSLVLSIVKVIIIFVLRSKLNKFYLYLKTNWYKNRFFIRYIFDVLMFLYVIMSCIFLILNR